MIWVCNMIWVFVVYLNMNRKPIFFFGTSLSFSFIPSIGDNKSDQYLIINSIYNTDTMNWWMRKWLLNRVSTYLHLAIVIITIYWRSRNSNRFGCVCVCACGALSRSLFTDWCFKWIFQIMIISMMMLMLIIARVLNVRSWLRIWRHVEFVSFAGEKKKLFYDCDSFGHDYLIWMIFYNVSQIQTHES